MRALAVEDGAPHWQASMATAWRTLPSAGGLLVLGEAELQALDVTSGGIRWHRALEAPPVAPAALAGDLVIVPLADGHLVAHDLAGSPVWRHLLGRPVRHPVASDGEDLLAAALDDGHVVGLDRASGATRWTTALPGVLGPPVITADRVFVGSSDNFFYALRAADGRLLWRWRTGGDVVGATGEAGLVYVVSLDNVLRALEADRGHQRWMQALSGRPAFAPVAARGVLVVGGISPRIDAVQQETGDDAGTFTAPEELMGAPLVLAPRPDGSNVTMVLLTRAGTLQGLRSVVPPAPPPADVDAPTGDQASPAGVAPAPAGAEAPPGPPPGPPATAAPLGSPAPR